MANEFTTLFLSRVLQGWCWLMSCPFPKAIPFLFHLTRLSLTPFIRLLLPDLWGINIDTDGCLIGFGFAVHPVKEFGTSDSNGNLCLGLAPPRLNFGVCWVFFNEDGNSMSCVWGEAEIGDMYCSPFSYWHAEQRFRDCDYRSLHGPGKGAASLERVLLATLENNNFPCELSFINL